MSDNYILGPDGKTPIRCNDILEFARWYDKADRRVALTERGDVRVSTVFLGHDHNFMGGRPVLWETLVFNGPLDNEMERYYTREEAEAGHAAMCARVWPDETPAHPAARTDGTGTSPGPSS